MHLISFTKLTLGYIITDEILGLLALVFLKINSQVIFWTVYGVWTESKWKFRATFFVWLQPDVSKSCRRSRMWEGRFLLFAKKIVFRLGLTSNPSSYLREIFKGVDRILYRYGANSLFSLQFRGSPQGFY